MPPTKNQGKRKTGVRPRRFTWARYTKENLLDLRFRDLGLTIAGTWLEGPIDQIWTELKKRGICLRPHFWLSEEWFSPAGVPGVAIPFYLAHPRLIRLEREKMLEVEGGSFDECLKILRHETGHAIQHAFQLQRKRRWQQLFGKSSARYPEYYRPKPSSKHFVLHLDRWYAQAHPDEDFAETFAVWFQPRSLWKKRYARWPALKKLEYVDELMTEIAGKKPLVTSKVHVDSLPRLRKTLRQHYKEKCARYTVNYPTIYDQDLKRLFSDSPRDRKRETAGAFVRRNRSEIRQLVSSWTGEYQFTLEQVLNDITTRCRSLKLHTQGSTRQLKLDFCILLTVHTMQVLLNRNQWQAL
jgi:hypothetical protein